MAKQRYSEGASSKEKQTFLKYLAEDEELVLATGYGKNYIRHRFAYYVLLPGIVFILVGIGVGYLFKFNLGIGLLLGLILATAVAFLKTVWTYHSHRYLLTTKRVIIKKGFFTVGLTSALYDKITHIEVEQGILDRMIMKHGAVIVNTAGMNKGEIRLNFIDYPIDFKNLLERLINREREQFGRPTGPVMAVEGELVEES